MSLRLISKKNDSVGVTVDVDAAIHNEAFHGQNGAVYGFSISLASEVSKPSLSVSPNSQTVLPSEVMTESV